MKSILPLLFLFISLSGFSQHWMHNTVSLEAGFGFHVPLLPTEDISRAKYINANFFHMGARYMFSRDLGLRMHYSYNGFRHIDQPEKGISIGRISVEGVYNMRNFFGFLENFDGVGLLAHAGFGLGGAKNYNNRNNSVDRLATIQFGFMPIIKLSPKSALFVDGSFVSTLKQNYHFTGEQIQSDSNGFFGTMSFGLIVYLGENKVHADWNNKPRNTLFR